MDSTLAPPVIIAARNGLPVLLSIPHSGREYPDWLLAEARHGRRALQSLEDPLVDRLAWRALSAGFGAVIARTPRGAIDCNRSPDEVDPASIVPESHGSPAPLGERARHGLGIIASRTRAHGNLWRASLSQSRFKARLARVHTTYHEAIQDRLACLVNAHGTALLLDLHSMPPTGREPAVVGDRHGTSAAPWLTDLACSIADRSGYRANRNDPYAGGYIVERHGRPEAGVHALQIELDRSSYLARDLTRPGPGFDRASHFLLALAQGLGEQLSTPNCAIAAE